MAVAEDVRAHRPEIVDVFITVCVPETTPGGFYDENAMIGRSGRSAQIAVRGRVVPLEFFGQFETTIMLHDAPPLTRERPTLRFWTG
jgi:hypothetical protein